MESKFAEFRSQSLRAFKPQHFLFVFCWGNPVPESRGERILFRPSWKMWRIFREISCSHFSWKLEKFRLNFALRNFLHNFCLRGAANRGDFWPAVEFRFVIAIAETARIRSTLGMNLEPKQVTIAPVLFTCEMIRLLLDQVSMKAMPA